MKQNQGRLREDIRDLFKGAGEFGLEGFPGDYATTLNEGHGHIEHRECWSMSEPACLEYLILAGDRLRAAVGGQGDLPPGDGDGHRGVDRYYVSSLSSPAGQLLEAVRAH